MTATLSRPAADDQPTIFRPLPRWFPAATVVASAAVSALLQLMIGAGIVRFLLLTAVIFTLVLYVASRNQEGSRRATDRFVTSLVTSSFLLAMLPLASLTITVITRGVARFDLAFFTTDMLGVVGAGGGGKAAIIGTFIITGLATVISVPVGLLTAIYLVEYGRGRLARSITFMVDVMTGIPSIVAGLFAYALFVIFFGASVRLGIGGAIALSVLMTPVVVRSSEEMLKLVPAELREASYALGVPKYRTILKVVLPAAAAGIATGITISIARVIGETAPLLLITGSQRGVNWNPFDGRMTTLPVYAFENFTQPGTSGAGIDRAWTAALVLMIIVLGLNLVARLIARFFAPKGAR